MKQTIAEPNQYFNISLPCVMQSTPELLLNHLIDWW